MDAVQQEIAALIEIRRAAKLLLLDIEVAQFCAQSHQPEESLISLTAARDEAREIADALDMALLMVERPESEKHD